MKKAIIVAVSLLGLAGVLYAADQYCPLHTYATCYNTFEIAPTGSNAQKWHCTCGDDIWVVPAPPPPAPAAPVEPPPDTSKQAQEMGHAIGSTIGQIIAQNRARHAEEKRDLTMIVYCRQNPTASITPNKKQINCVDFNNFTVAYCSVHDKEKLCKDAAKLAPQAQAPAQAPVQAPVVTTPQVQKEQPAEQPVAQQQPVTRPVTQPQPQPQQAPSGTQPATTAPEISVAEAARQARIAKAIREAKEKAERDNPPPASAQSSPGYGKDTEGKPRLVLIKPSAPPRMDIPAIAKAANGAIVTVVMANNDKPIASGTGFLVSQDGVIVTNYHVIETGNVAIVKFPDGTVLAVDGVLAVDKIRDLAVIKIHGKTFRTLTLGNSDRIQVGEAVVAIGNPLSLESTVSNGIVSGVRTAEKFGGKFLQTTAPISPGSSGGPLFNMAGEVVGITTLYLKGGENLNFAIPVNDAKLLLQRESAKLQDLPNEAPAPVRADTETHAGTLAQQKACSEQAERLLIEEQGPDPKIWYSTQTSHFNSASGVCYAIVTRPRTRPTPDILNWIYIHHIYNAFEGRVVGGFDEIHIYPETGHKLVGRSCSVYPPGQPDITCKSEEEFNALVLKYFGIAP